MEELERNLKEEIRLREKAEKRLKFLMKKLESIKGSRSSEGSNSSEVSCISSVCTSASKEENGAVDEEKTDHATGNVASMEEADSNSKLKDVASTSSHEEESQAGNEFSWYSDAT